VFRCLRMSEEHGAWHPDDVRDLVRLIKAGANAQDLAPYLARSEAEIRDKAREVGFEDEAGTWINKPPAPSMRRETALRRRA
jgi:hypothetical protein